MTDFEHKRLTEVAAVKEMILATFGKQQTEATFPSYVLTRPLPQVYNGQYFSKVHSNPLLFRISSPLVLMSVIIVW